MTENFIAFLDSNGNLISNDQINNHEELARCIIDSNNDLKGKRKEDEYIVDFLVQQGYAKVMDRKGFPLKTITYCGSRMNDTQLGVISRLKADGYKVDDVDRLLRRDDMYFRGDSD